MTDQSRTSSTSPDCDRLRDLLPAYSIGATDPEETRFVEATLPHCPEVALELKPYVQASQLLYGRVPRASRPAGMHERFMARVQTEEAQKGQQPSITPPKIVPMPASRKDASADKKNERRLLWVGLVAASLLLFTNLYWITQLNTTRSAQDEMQRQLQAVSSILSGHYRQVKLASDDFSATVAWRPGGQEAVLLAERLPELPADQTYQLWVIQGDQPLDAGIFQRSADGTVTLIFEPPQPLDEASAVAISTERAGGSPTPTNPVAIGQIQEL